MMISPKIIIADDHSVVRQGLSLLIKEVYAQASIIQATDLKDLSSKLKEGSFDLLILDIHFPEGNCLASITEIKEAYKNLKILLFSGSAEESFAVRFVKAGVNGYVNKLSPDDEIQNAVKSVLEYGQFFTSSMKQRLLDDVLNKSVDNPLLLLSEREMEVAQLMVSGYGNLEISNKLSIQKTTVSTYKNRIFEKLNISNVVSLVSIFQENKAFLSSRN